MFNDSFNLFEAILTSTLLQLLNSLNFSNLKVKQLLADDSECLVVAMFLNGERDWLILADLAVSHAVELWKGFNFEEWLDTSMLVNYR